MGHVWPIGPFSAQMPIKSYFRTGGTGEVEPMASQVSALHGRRLLAFAS
jgi:hypothetical protein